MAQELSDFKWKNRVLLLMDNGVNTQNIDQQIEAFKNHSAAFQERDLVYFIITPKSIYNSEKTPIKLGGLDAHQKNNFKGLILLGKDGGIKLKESFVVSAEVIIALIDSMPMRRSEIKSQK
jgi:hypothetical protein